MNTDNAIEGKVSELEEQLMTEGSRITVEKEVIDTKEYKIELIKYSDGSTTFRRTNDGFNPYELIGLLSIVKDEIYDQFKGVKIPIDLIERKAVKFQ